VLARYERLEAIPDDPRAWDVDVRGASALAESLRAHRDEVFLYRTLATLRTDVPLDCDLETLRYVGARRAGVEALEARLGGEDVASWARVVG
jgi:5'-3' exonuclease